MRAAASTSDDELFTVDEVAEAAGVAPEHVWQLVRVGEATAYGRHVSVRDAAHLMRVLRGLEASSPRQHNPLTLTPDASRRAGRGLAASSVLHGLGLLTLLLLTSLGLLSANDTEMEIKDPKPTRLVYLMLPGPGGGGGGGGLKMPQPPPQAAKKAVKVVRRTSNPVPPPKRRAAPPPPPAPTRPPQPDPPPPRIEPLIVAPKPEQQAIKAPVAPVAADLQDAIGMLAARPASPSNGPGTGGGVGTGAGPGVGEGTGGGIGPGTGGGTGGGPYQPGAGVDPPVLVREVRPTYTDEARRQSIEGDVVLEIVVRRDGTVGNVRVRRTLGAGLEQRAIDAVRQWRFIPAKKSGTPVDVVVDVSVEFKLRIP